ncbi:hypothetical protein [Dictyobacter vulcani]|uniref:hypothetical protein n=1 Tax=Dictyobacter vulcani TaxID=2607529 RepID=UPI0013867A47|nr:hypothetical protein [Dictyobacter vulcani]
MELSTQDLKRILADAMGRAEDVAALAQRICAVPAPTGRRTSARGVCGYPMARAWI